jgi:ABC-2 type transport system ATP-binding protein
MRGAKNNSLRDNLIERFELEADWPIRKMSKGMKQKLALVAAFMHDPEVLILDEPTSGLDPLMQRRFIGLILEEKQRGKTILMSSHRFDEIERTCSSAAIIREGKIVAIEDVATLKTSQRKSYLVSVAGSQDLDIIRTSGLEYAVVGNNQVEIFVGDDYSKILSTLARCHVTGLDTVNQTLEEIFIGYYGKEDDRHVMDIV